MPFSAFLMLTYQCNRRCPYCFNNGIELKEHSLDLEDIKMIVEKLKNMGCNFVILTGGEPLLIKELSEFIRIFKSYNIEVLLITNSELFTENRMQELKSAGLNFISITPHFLFDDKMKDINFELKRLSLLIDKLLRQNYRFISLIYLISPDSVKILDRVVNIVNNYSIGLIVQPIYENRNNYRSNIYEVKESDWDTVIKLTSQWHGKNYFSYIKSLYFKGKSYPNYCPCGGEVFVIDSNGEIYPCFHRRDLKSGNILKDSEEKILKNLEKVFLETKDAKCFGKHCVSMFTGF